MNFWDAVAQTGSLGITPEEGLRTLEQARKIREEARARARAAATPSRTFSFIAFTLSAAATFALIHAIRRR